MNVMRTTTNAACLADNPKEVNTVGRIFQTLEHITDISHAILRKEIGLADALLGSGPTSAEKDAGPGQPGVLHQAQYQLDVIRTILNKVQAEQSRFDSVVDR